MRRPLPGLGGQMPPATPSIMVHPDMGGQAGETAKLIEHAVASELHDATQRFTKVVPVTGASFVFMGIKHFWTELRGLNPQATADYFRALADLAEPGRDHDAMVNAELRRRDARASLLASLDADMKQGGEP